MWLDLASATTDLVWIQNSSTEIGFNLQMQPQILWSDNLGGAKALACNPVYHACTKHVELDVHFVHNLVSEHKLEVRHIPTELQLADLLTKALLMDRFQIIGRKLTMEESPSEA